MVWSKALNKKANMHLQKRFKQTKVKITSTAKPSASMFQPGGMTITML
jgi:hypothetical protein